MTTNNAKGKLGEKIAKEFLKANKYKILDQNFRVKHGEIDLVVLDEIKQELVFIEVKTRTNFVYGAPIEAINKNKMRHIIDTAKLYIYIKGYENINIRFDAIEVYLTSKEIKINHTKRIV